MKGISKAIAYFIFYLILSMILQVLSSTAFMAIAASTGLREEALLVEYGNNNLLGITIFSGILTVTALYLLFKLRKKQVKQEWKLNKFSVKDVALASIISFSFSFLFALCTYHISMENSQMISKSVAYYSEIFPSFGIILMAINLLVIAPATEEIALRGIVYTRAEKTTNGITAIIVSSVLFGIMHFQAGGAVLVVGAVFMALVFGYIFYKFDSLWVCIIAHAAANLPDFILLSKPDFSNGLFIGLLIFFVCMFILGIFFVEKRTHKKV